MRPDRRSPQDGDRHRPEWSSLSGDDVELVDENRSELLVLARDFVQADHEDRQAFTPDANAHEPFSALDARRTRGLVVMPARGEGDGQVPPEPERRQDAACTGGDGDAPQQRSARHRQRAIAKRERHRQQPERQHPSRGERRRPREGAARVPWTS